MARRGVKDTAAATAAPKLKRAARAPAHATPANRGGRAVPGTAPLGPFHTRSGGKFTSLGRLVLDCLDRGVIMLDATGFVLDANVPALRAQAEVARRLFAGRNVEQAARSMRLSPNTVRSHLKQIFTKCEVQSQAELMHLLAQGPSSL